MNKLVIAIAAIGLGTAAFAPAVMAYSIPTLQQSDFEDADQDNSSTLTFQELSSSAPALTLAQFEGADANGDGLLSLGEFNSLNPERDSMSRRPV